MNVAPNMCHPSVWGWLNNEHFSRITDLRAELIAKGKPLLDLSMINPDIPPPRLLLDRLIEAGMKPHNHRYSVARGIRKLREAFANKYASSFNATLDPESQVVVTMGTKDALSHALMCLCPHREPVLVGSPTYPAYSSALRLLQIPTSTFTVQDDEGSMLNEIASYLDPALPADRRARVVLVNFPHNPTGISVSSSFYSKLIALAKAAGAFVLNDFTYGEMYFGSPPPSALAGLSPEDPVLETYTLSKAYSVPGWRVGACAGNREICLQLGQLKKHVDYGVFLPIQLAACAALTAPRSIVEGTVGQYVNRLSVLSKGLAQVGWIGSKPSAGCSLWVKIPNPLAALGSYEIAYRLLSEVGVMSLPGELFGAQWKNSLRFAAVLPEDRLASVAELVGRFSQR